MNPDVFKKKTPHVYTQEEAVELHRINRELEYQLDEQGVGVEKLRNKLDIALSIMSKEQLIEFINKTL